MSLGRGLLVVVLAAASPRAAEAVELRGVVTTTRAASSARVEPLHDVHVCRKPDGLATPIIERGPAGGLADAVVWIEPSPGAKPRPPSKKVALLDQVGCRFVPRVLAVERGARLRLRNSDPVFHNAHVYRPDGTTLLSISTPLRGQEADVAVLSSPGHYRVGCDAGHDWMRADVWVLDTPSFAVTTSDGAFVLQAPSDAEVEVVVEHWAIGQRRVRARPSSGALQLSL